MIDMNHGIPVIRNRLEQYANFLNGGLLFNNSLIHSDIIEIFNILISKYYNNYSVLYEKKLIKLGKSRIKDIFGDFNFGSEMSNIFYKKVDKLNN